MKSIASSIKSFKCDCCDYISSQSNNLSRHKKSKHSQAQLKKGGDDVSDISENDEQSLSNKECHFCINYKQIIEIKDRKIADLEKQIEILQKDSQIAILQTKLECKDIVLDFSGNFIEKQHQTLEKIIESKQIQSPPQKGRPKQKIIISSEESTEDSLPTPILPTPEPPPAPKPPKKKALTKDELKQMDYAETMKEIEENMKKSSHTAKPTKQREIDVDYLNETCGNTEPFENLIENVFQNTKYFAMSNISEEQLKICHMKKNDYYVFNMQGFENHLLKPSKSKKALMEYQVDFESKEKFYNSLFLEAFEKQKDKSFYYVKKTKQSFYKDKDSWKICENEDIEKIMKRFENRLFKVACYSRNLIKIGVIPPSKYGYDSLNYDVLNSDRPLYNMPPKEKQLLEALMNQWAQGLMADCNNERWSAILFKKIKQIYDAKATHNSDVCVKYEKEEELLECDEAKSDDEEEEE